MEPFKNFLYFRKELLSSENKEKTTFKKSYYNNS